MNLNWNLQRDSGVQTKTPSVERGVGMRGKDIFWNNTFSYQTLRLFS